MKPEFENAIDQATLGLPVEGQQVVPQSMSRSFEALYETYLRAGEAASHLLDPEVFPSLPIEVREELFRIARVDPNTDDSYQQLVTNVNQQIVKMGITIRGRVPIES